MISFSCHFSLFQPCSYMINTHGKDVAENWQRVLSSYIIFFGVYSFSLKTSRSIGASGPLHRQSQNGNLCNLQHPSQQCFKLLCRCWVERKLRRLWLWWRVRSKTVVRLSSLQYFDAWLITFIDVKQLLEYSFSRTCSRHPPICKMPWMA